MGKVSDGTQNKFDHYSIVWSATILVRVNPIFTLWQYPIGNLQLCLKIKLQPQERDEGQSRIGLLKRKLWKWSWNAEIFKKTYFMRKKVQYFCHFWYLGWKSNWCLKLELASWWMWAWWIQLENIYKLF